MRERLARQLLGVLDVAVVRRRVAHDHDHFVGILAPSHLFAADRELEPLLDRLGDVAAAARRERREAHLGALHRILEAREDARAVGEIAHVAIVNNRNLELRRDRAEHLRDLLQREARRVDRRLHAAGRIDTKNDLEAGLPQIHRARDEARRLRLRVVGFRALGTRLGLRHRLLAIVGLHLLPPGLPTIVVVLHLGGEPPQDLADPLPKERRIGAELLHQRLDDRFARDARQPRGIGAPQRLDGEHHEPRILGIERLEEDRLRRRMPAPTERHEDDRAQRPVIGLAVARHQVSRLRLVELPHLRGILGLRRRVARLGGAGRREERLLARPGRGRTEREDQ